MTLTATVTGVRRTTKWQVLVVAGTLLLAASCGASDERADDQETTDEQTAGDDRTDAGDSQAIDGIDCAALQEALVTVGSGVQLLAQLTSQAQYDAVRSGAIVFDPDDFDSALAVLQPLDAYQNPLGSVDEALEFYGEANALARENLVVEDPFAEAKGDELAALNEDTAEFLGWQSAISYARDEAGC